MFSITPVYAALITLLFVWLSIDVIRNRRRALASLGDKGDKALQTAIRAHGNCAEYAPLALLLMGFAEVQGGGALFLHALGCALLCGRLLHGFGLRMSPLNLLPRQLGMALTFGVLIVAAIANLILTF